MDSIFDYNFEQMQDYCVQKLESKPFLATQIFDWVYKKQNFNVEQWVNVSKINKAKILENFSFELPKIIWVGESKDGTRKFLVRLHDKQTIECVVIPAKDRRTLCVSSQVGCAIGCTFCHTGTQGLTRHLKTSEIVGQYLEISRWLRQKGANHISNIVYMGQGEPLHNYENVKRSAELLIDPKGLGLGQRRITLSTSGLVPKIEQLFNFPSVNIAISLHSARNDVRTELMPINKVYDLDRLFKAIKSIPLKASRRITYEYILIKDLNDSPEDLDALVELLDRKESKINIIPFNEYPESKFKRPSDDKIKWFNDTLNKRGFTSTVRVSKGDDILAACGQLKSEFEKKNLWSAGKQKEMEENKSQQIFR